MIPTNENFLVYFEKTFIFSTTGLTIDIILLLCFVRNLVCVFFFTQPDLPAGRLDLSVFINMVSVNSFSDDSSVASRGLNSQSLNMTQLTILVI
ncbi:MAG: hypothetical protein KAS07_04540, partial [Candidatus Pacebacteria bacterium]|nr:hypothetical protein [Candidatus Paceibacterota bacterium]